MNISPQPGSVAQRTYVLGATPAAQPAVATSSTDAIVKAVMQQLELESKQLEIEERRSRRIWAAVAGLATLTTAMVGLMTFLNQRKKG